MQRILGALVVALLLLRASSVQAAVPVIDSREVGDAGHRSITSPLTWTFTNTAGTRLMVGCVASGGTATAVLTSATDNGVAMTKVGNGILSGLNSSLTQWFTLTNPATGAHPISVVWSSAGTVRAVNCGAFSLSGVDPTTPFGPEVTATGQGLTADSGVITNSVGNLVLSLVSAGTSVETITPPDAATFRVAGSNQNSGDNLAASTWVSTGTSHRVVWAVNGTTSDWWAIDALEVRGAAGPPPPTVTATASWLANPESDIAGYTVSYGTASGVYTTVLPLTNVLQITIPGFMPGTTYFFILTASNTSGLTGPASPEIAWLAPTTTLPTVVISNVRIVAYVR